MLLINLSPLSQFQCQLFINIPTPSHFGCWNFNATSSMLPPLVPPIFWNLSHKFYTFMHLVYPSSLDQNILIFCIIWSWSNGRRYINLWIQKNVSVKNLNLCMFYCLSCVLYLFQNPHIILSHFCMCPFLNILLLFLPWLSTRGYWICFLNNGVSFLLVVFFMLI